MVILGTGTGGITDQGGHFLIPRLPVGAYTVRARVVGFRMDDSAGVRVEAGDTTLVTFRLAEQALKIFVCPLVPNDPFLRNPRARPLVATRGVLYLGGNRLEAPLAFAMNGARIVVNGRSLPPSGTKGAVRKRGQANVRIAFGDESRPPEIVAVPGPIPIDESNAFDELDNEAVRASFALRAALESLTRGELVLMSHRGLASVRAQDAAGVDCALELLRDHRLPNASQWRLLADNVPMDMLSELEEPVRLDEVGK